MAQVSEQSEQGVDDRDYEMARAYSSALRAEVARLVCENAKLRQDLEAAWGEVDRLVVTAGWLRRGLAAARASAVHRVLCCPVVR